MHENIETIVKRAGALLLAAHQEAQGDEGKQERLKNAFSKLNPSQSMEEASLGDYARRLPHDPDGSETECAAHLVAVAMGLRWVSSDCLDEPAVAPGEQHMVVWRHMDETPEEESINDRRRQKAVGAGLFVEIVTNTPHTAVGFGKKIQVRSKPTAPATPRQRSFF